MTAAEAAAIADEHIAFWNRQNHRDKKMTASAAWALLSPDHYPGGGWERVRAFMVGWLLEWGEQCETMNDWTKSRAS